MDLLCFCSVLCLLCLCARLFICALWSPAGKGLTSWLSFVVSTVSLSLSHRYPGSGVVLDCIDSWYLHPYLLSSGHHDVALFEWLRQWHWIDNYVIIASLNSESACKVINRMPGPGSCLLISSLHVPGSALRTHVQSLGKSRDVNTQSQSLARCTWYQNTLT